MQTNDDVQQIDAPDIQSLNWRDDVLIDWVGGARVLHLDGAVEDRKVIYGYRFDAAVVSPCEQFAVIYERCGTKGLVLSNGKVIREINRSFYHADAYEYPVAIFQTDTGRTLLIHCPEEYCRLEIEDFLTGERLSASPSRKPPDFFHSRLRVSPNGKWLLSAGWLWHPWGTVAIFDLDAALAEPNTLDKSAPLPDIEGEVSAADFMPNNTIVIATSDETLNGDEGDASAIGANAVAVFEPGSTRAISRVAVGEPVGTIFAVDDDLIVGFHTHPKLISVKAGAILKRWETIESGTQSGSIIWHLPTIPPIAWNSKNRQFAVANKSSVAVVTLDR